ncbi:hypothetical protein GCM10010174_52520 [Kutzneria viridogrisea]|uniref:DUF5709 domain-containing protein n=1 Tax=Kutzneria viridogrisea TaxID=47990 RepID=A0ABR6BJ55_9PSEU|nr:hypothetical protein [Kutzneria viridogrisea]
MSDIHRHQLRRTWPERQRLDTRDGQLERRELPASNPAELAGYAETGDTGDADTEQSYVDLGLADDTPPASDGDEFGSAGLDDHIELDAA